MPIAMIGTRAGEAASARLGSSTTRNHGMCEMRVKGDTIVRPKGEARHLKEEEKRRRLSRGLNVEIKVQT